MLFKVSIFFPFRKDFLFFFSFRFRFPSTFFLCSIYGTFVLLMNLKFHLLQLYSFTVLLEITKTNSKFKSRYKSKDFELDDSNSVKINGFIASMYAFWNITTIHCHRRNLERKKERVRASIPKRPYLRNKDNTI